jgi:hypothetical protein
VSYKLAKAAAVAMFHRWYSMILHVSATAGSLFIGQNISR